MTTKRKVGRSDLETLPLILGGNVFDWTADKTTSFAVLDAFMAGGGTMIDTADAYSAWMPGHRGGESERVIGEWLKKRGKRDDVIITTKVGMLPGEGGEGLAPARVAAAIDASLTNLQIDYVDLYLAHKDDEAQDQGAVAEAFDKAVKAGKVRYVGASNFDRKRLSSALAAQEKAGAARYVALQNEYNLLKRSAFEGELQAYCVEQGIGMTPYFGLASGYLTGKYRKPEDLTGMRGQGMKEYMEGNGPHVLAALDAVSEALGATQAQVALAWLAAQPGIAAPIASATSVKQLEDIMGSIRLALSDDQLRQLDEASKVAEPA